jgi:hypothetical protein
MKKYKFLHPGNSHEITGSCGDLAAPRTLPDAVPEADAVRMASDVAAIFEHVAATGRTFWDRAREHFGDLNSLSSEHWRVLRSGYRAQQLELADTAVEYLLQLGPPAPQAFEALGGDWDECRCLLLLKVLHLLPRQAERGHILLKFCEIHVEGWDMGEVHDFFGEHLGLVLCAGFELRNCAGNEPMP